MGYRTLRSNAPRRRQPYLSINRTGVAPLEQTGRRMEERLAMALFNRGEIEIVNRGGLRIIDYQMPLKSVRGDRGVGKIDLLAATEHGALAVVELKVWHNKEDRRVGLLEALAYTAILEANISVIAKEILVRHGFEVEHARPEILVVAPLEFWTNARGFPSANRMIELAAEIAERESLNIDLVYLDGVASFDQGLGGSKPTVTGNIRLVPLSR